jgi:hypothetical protein
VVKRNSVREWTRAMGRRGAMGPRGVLDMNAMQPLVAQAFETDVPVPPGELPSWLRRSKPVAPSSTILEANAETIRVLQRGNALLSRRFGIDWADAATVVFGEAARRGASPVSLARVLTAGLRRDAKGAGA